VYYEHVTARVASEALLRTFVVVRPAVTKAESSNANPTSGRLVPKPSAHLPRECRAKAYLPITFHAPRTGRLTDAAPETVAINERRDVAVSVCDAPFHVSFETALGARNSMVVVPFRSPFYGSLRLSSDVTANTKGAYQDKRVAVYRGVPHNIRPAH
jgi:hypothetical protein